MLNQSFDWWLWLFYQLLALLPLEFCCVFLMSFVHLYYLILQMMLLFWRTLIFRKCHQQDTSAKQPSTLLQSDDFFNANKAGHNVRSSIHKVFPISTKFDMYIRDRWVLHNGMPYDRIQVLHFNWTDFLYSSSFHTTLLSSLGCSTLGIWILPLMWNQPAVPYGVRHFKNWFQMGKPTLQQFTCISILEASVDI